ncbi:MAG: ABC transporter ATP-binding protein [Acidilobaceae archaeon]
MGSSGAVVAEGLAKRYSSGVWGARSVSFAVGYGELVVLLGPNGSGKTTTISILATLIKPTSGRGLVGGYDVVREAERVREIVAVMPQDGRPDPNWTPYEAVKWYLVARGFSLSAASGEARVWLEELGLWSVRNTPLWELSRGQMKRTLAAMVLASGAPVLFLDEPTSDVDVEGKYETWGALRRAVGSGRAVLYTTHDMREAERIADRVVMISSGVTVAEGSPRELVESLPFRFRVVVRDGGSAAPPAGASYTLRLGGSTIAYYESRSEALVAVGELEGSEASIEPVGLEDAYLYHVRIRGEQRG